jgi:hypothetical protein
MNAKQEVKPARNIPTPPPKAEKVRAPVDMKLDRKAAVTAKISHAGIDPQGHKAARIEYWLPVEHTYENTKDPSYWLPLGEILKRAGGDYTGSIIMVRAKDHHFYAELYVTDISPTGVRVEELIYKPLGCQPADLKSTMFKWVWSDTQHGYDIIRVTDGVKVVEAKQMKRLQSVKDWLEKWDI